MNGHTPQEQLLKRTMVSIGASETNTVASEQFPVSNDGSTNFRADIYMGRVVGAPVLKLQDSSGLNLWADNKTAAASASTQKTVSAVSDTADTLTSAAHGYTSGQPVVINSSNGVAGIPGGLEQGKVYYVNVLDANTVEMHANRDLNSRFDITSAGTGTITLTLVTRFEIVVTSYLAADITSGFAPVNSMARVVCSSAGGESAQIVAVKIVQEN